MTLQENNSSNSPRGLDMKLEVIVIPVSNVERAKAFYTGLGWRLDADFPGEDDLRVVQVTPPGSQCSVIFGTKLTSARPGSAQRLHLIVSDIELAHAELVSHGVEISGVFHDAGGVFHHSGNEHRLPGPNPDRKSYKSYATFSDPDGNEWVLQEVTARLPDRVDLQGVAYVSANELAEALRRAAAAHGEHEKRAGGKHDDNWPDWYSRYLVAEQSGSELPS